MDALVSKRQEALIVGGGPAGAALAILLARGGRSVEIIEQSTAMHHKVCGEFLSSEAIAYLGRLGVDLPALGAAAIHGVRLSARRTIAACDLPFPAMSLSRRTLDEALLLQAAHAGAMVLRGQRVERIERNATGWIAQLAGGEKRHVPTVFLATGKHDVASHRRPLGRQNGLIAFKMYFRLTPAQLSALRGWVELFLFPSGYAGLQLVEQDQANLCLLVKQTTLSRCHNKWQALLDHMCSYSAPLAERLDAALPLMSRPLAISSIPYGMLLSDAEPGMWRLGDQAAVIPSFSGDGMSIALHSAHLAAEIYTRGGTSAEFSRQLRSQLGTPVHFAVWLSRLMIVAPVLAQALRIWPGLLSEFAQHTRISRRLLLTEPAAMDYRGAA